MMARRIFYVGPPAYGEAELRWQREREREAVVLPRSDAPARRCEAGERHVAEHEAAHAVASLLTGGGVGEIKLNDDGRGIAGEFRTGGTDRGPMSETDFAALAVQIGADIRGSTSPSRMNWAINYLVVHLAPLAYRLAFVRMGAGGFRRL